MVVRNNAFLKDVWRSIAKTKARFLSIITIIAIGVGFFAGINATEPDMVLSADKYYKASRLADFRLLSPLGFEADDIEKVEQINAIKTIQPGYSKDLFIGTEEGNQAVVRLFSYNPDDYENNSGLNQLEVIKGKLPEKPGEIVFEITEETSAIKIGSKVKVFVPEEEKLEDFLQRDTFEIVGFVQSPLTINFEKGQTNIGDGSINYHAYIHPDNFAMEHYTDLFIQTKKSQKLTAYTDTYNNHIESIQTELEDLGSDIMVENIADLRQEIAEGYEELEENKQKAEDEFQAAEKELANAEKQVADGEKELETNRAKYSKQLEEARAEIKQGKEQLASGKAAYEENLKKWEAGYEEFLQGKEQLNQAKQELDEAKSQIETGENELTQAKQELETAEIAINQLGQTITKLERLTQTITTNPPTSDLEYEEIVLAQQLYPEELTKTLLQFKNHYSPETVPMIVYTIDEMIGNVEANKTDAEKQYANGKTAIFENEQKLQAAKRAYESGLKEYEQGVKELEALEAEINLGKQQLDRAKAEIDQSEEKLQEGEQELRTQEAKLNDELAKAELQLNEAKAEIADGRATLEEEKQKAETEIADWEQELKDAEKQLADIPKEWFVTTREAFPGYSGYGDDAERIGAVAKVFPLFFFLVAALVSLTTMTRMVEEERIQIGTFKALGYGTGMIASKYLAYAILTSVIGTVVGLLVGYQLFPKIIMYAYSIMYDIPIRVTVFHWDYAVISLLMAVATTTIATLTATLSELRQTPAQLMQPKAPKPGKRILLERIKPIWSRLSFSQKVSFRNVFRFKRRFYMTVLGIAGCTALLITAFGLSDSISDVSGKQFSQIFKYDGQVVFDTKEANKSDIEKIMTSEKQIQQYLPVQTETVDAKGNQSNQTYIANIMVIDNEKALQDFIHLKERPSKKRVKLTDEGVIINEKLAKLIQVDVGDTFTFHDPDNRAFDVLVTGITENYMSHYIYFTTAYYEKVTNEPVEFNTALFITKELPSDQQMELKETLLKKDGLNAVIFLDSIAESFNETMEMLNTVVLILIISAGLLAFVVLFNLTNINIMERIREIATIKVLGFRNREVDAYIFRENLYLSIIGTFVGLVLGVLLHRYVIQTMEIDMVMFGQSVHFSSFIWSILLTLIFSILVNLFMHKKLKNVDMVESLKSIE